MQNLIKERVALHAFQESELIPVPNLISNQIDSFKKFISEGIKEELLAISPIKGFSDRYELEFLETYEVLQPEGTLEDCREKEITFASALKVQARLIDKETGEVKVQDVFLGEIPMMTNKGTFVINGVERVVVSQFVRSPGVYFKKKTDKQGIETYHATVIPNRGAWLEVESDRNGVLFVHINKMRKLPLTVFLAALGIDQTKIRNSVKDESVIEKTLEKCSITNPQEALYEIYQKMRPGDPFTADAAKNMLNGLFFDTRTYDLGRVGRYKVNNRLGLKVSDNVTVLTHDDIFQTVNVIIDLMNHESLTDDIDHLGNRRVRAVGELLQKQFRVGLARLERLVKEQITLRGNEEITPQKLINVRPLMAVMREFFGSSQLSQFMDQTNPLAELSHRRRLSALGPGGLTKERAGFEVRDIHPSHYGRICVVETPEGPNAGLIGPLGIYARINNYGFVEAPYRKVINGTLTKEIIYLTADLEDYYKIAPYDVKTVDSKFVENKVPVRYKKEFIYCSANEVQLMVVSPRQMLGITTALIPFIEHDDANRALMGSNMQRQATPLFNTEPPIVGTGMERYIARDAGALLIAEEDGKVVKMDAMSITIKSKSSEKVYKLTKYQRSNQSTWINHRPTVTLGESVSKGQSIADGASCKNGELSLGQNILVAFMPWEGLNFEDSILISERLVSCDIFSTVHISKFEIDVRSTKLGDEEITREVVNVSEELLKNLDENGIIRIGAEVKPGDILVGKVTPKGETEPPAEEKLLRAIFGDKARDMKDTSLRVPPGEFGKIIDVKIISRENNDALPPGVNKIIRIYISHLRRVSIGDKMAGRHGNKGVISKILPLEDMPMLPDGRAVDMVLNPLGVPSRMNVGQIYETLLGGAGKALNKYYEIPPFDEVLGEEASNNAIKEELRKASKVPGYEWLNETGKVKLRDGRSGKSFDRPVTVGWMYMMKLIHLVDDKIHARSTGPYSLVTQQPLGGKAQFGGQRFGEMEVWALEAYGAAFILQEILTIKSDDVTGRAKAYESIIKGRSISKSGTPESFRVLVRELRSLGLDMKVLDEDNVEIEKI